MTSSFKIVCAHPLNIKQNINSIIFVNITQYQIITSYIKQNVVMNAKNNMQIKHIL